MRETPTWRIPFGIISLFVVLMIYGVVIARYAPSIIGHWSGAAQTVVYLVLGLIWLLPLRRFLIWMETGSWCAQRRAGLNRDQCDWEIVPLPAWEKVARVTGLEPATFGVTGRRSNRLSYTRALFPFRASRRCRPVRWSSAIRPRASGCQRPPRPA
jgi:hypothetical protein